MYSNVDCCFCSTASPFLQILAVLEKVQGLMIRCFGGKQVKNNFSLDTVSYYLHC